MSVVANQQAIGIFNNSENTEQPKSFYINCDFSVDTVWSVELVQAREFTRFQSIRTIYYNLLACANDVIVVSPTTQQRITFKAGKQGYMPILVSLGMQLSITGVSPDVAQFNLLNVDMPPYEWPQSGGSGGTYTAGAGLQLIGTQFSVPNGGITRAMLANGAATSVIGRAAGTIGAEADIAATADGQVLQRAGGVLTFAAPPAPGSGTVPLSSLATQAANTVVANNTAGVASPTAVPYASMPWVLKAGDTMTGDLSINSAGPYLLSLRRTGSTGTFLRIMTNNTANNSLIGETRFFGVNSVSVDSLFSGMAGRIITNTSGAEDGQIEYSTIVAGAYASRFNIKQGVYTPNATGGDKGADTANVISYYENGTALTAKYAQLGVTNTFLQGQNIGNGSGIQYVILNGGNSGSNAGGLFSVSNGGTLIGRWGNKSAVFGIAYDATLVYYSNGSGHDFLNSVATSIFKAYEAGGVTIGSPTGGSQGAGTANANSYYANGSLSIDSSNTHYTSVFTFATLPAATANRRAIISDGAAAPVFSAAAAGGGTLRTPVYADGSIWRNG